MLSYLYHALRSFRPVFSRHRAWLTFCMLTLGFLGAPQILGLTSFCRFWAVEAAGYHCFLHFFRASSWSLSQLELYWGSFVLAQQQTILVAERAVLLGDHTYTPKDGRRMPGVVTLRQDSETQSKPSYFRGHCWGALALLVGSVTAPFSLPLALSLHQGFVHLGHNSQQESHKKTLGSRMVSMALDFAWAHDLPCVLVLDAFFSVSSVFQIANSIWSTSLKKPLITVIVRAKKSYVAYFEAEKPRKRKRGRPRKYGLKVKLVEFFDHQHLFTRVEARIYGKVETISLACVDLLWKPTGGLIRFVFAVTSRGPLVLMCSDLQQNPLMAVELYCLRIRIEVMFSALKQLIGAFEYHFWSKYMPRHSRRPKRNQELKRPSEGALKRVQLAWGCCERFVMIAAIALGLLQLIALRFPKAVWNQFDAFLRTRSRELPSERTVKHVLARQLVQDFLSVAPSAMMRDIRERHGEPRESKFDDQPPPDS